MNVTNELRPIYLKLGASWEKAEPLLEFDFPIIPARGDAIDIMKGMETPTTVRIIDVKHSIIDDLCMTEMLVWPDHLVK